MTQAEAYYTQKKREVMSSVLAGLQQRTPGGLVEVKLEAPELQGWRSFALGDTGGFMLMRRL